MTYRVDRFAAAKFYRFHPEPPVYAATLELLVAGAERSSWSHARDIIAYDIAGGNGYSDVWVIRPDGTDNTPITSLIGALPTKHVGNPAWSPNGDWLVVQAMEQDFASNLLGSPGVGLKNALWAIRWSTFAATKLTTPGVGLDNGALHPFFSADGTKLMWSRPELHADYDPDSVGWFHPHSLVTADFVVTGGVPALQNVTSHYPFGEARKYATFESNSWDGDSNDKFFFMTNAFSGSPALGLTLCRYTISTGEVEIMTDTQTEWSEFFQTSPNREFYVYSSTMGNDFRGALGYIPMDLYIMKADLTERGRLTDLSNPDHANYNEVGGGPTGTIYSAADPSIGPDNVRLTTKITGTAPGGGSTGSSLYMVTITEGI